MQPLCLLLPAGTDMAVRLWSVLELGVEARALCRPASSRSDTIRLSLAAPARHSALPDHVAVLASLFRAHLFGVHPGPGGLWLERRELADVLRLVESGLNSLDDARRHSEEGFVLTLEAVSVFLAGIRAQMGMFRKPAQRHAATRARGVLAAGA